MKSLTKSNLLPFELKENLNQAIWIATFSLITAIGAQVAIPTQPVPFTLQTMAVLLAGAFLGSRKGAVSQTAYLAAGAIGLPVFAAFGFGIAKLFGPTGGYLLSFPFASFLVGYILERKNNLVSIILAFIAGQALILISGAAYLSIFMNGDFASALFSGAVIFSIWDIAKIAAATGIFYSFSKK